MVTFHCTSHGSYRMVLLPVGIDCLGRLQCGLLPELHRPGKQKISLRSLTECPCMTCQGPVLLYTFTGFSISGLVSCRRMRFSRDLAGWACISCSILSLRETSCVGICSLSNSCFILFSF